MSHPEQSAQESQSGPSQSGAPDQTPDQAASFDARLARLEEIVHALEEGELELEPAIARYKEGVGLLKDCRGLLGQYRAQVEELTAEAQASLRPYDQDPDVKGA
jgi:exodeoxyribonuclease VII small subunit